MLHLRLVVISTMAVLAGAATLVLWLTDQFDLDRLEPQADVTDA
ncbi:MULTISPECIES: hypothetical protein [Thiorhodovibrio]|nr:MULTISPECIES: hypothetical protein [Thiorhodovibrio]